MKTKTLAAAVGIVFFVALWAALRGIDFGYHWDEHRVTESVSKSVETGILLPGWYYYPSVSYDLAMVSIAPEAVGAATQLGELVSAKKRLAGVGQRLYDVQERLAGFALSETFKLRARRVFAVTTLLGIVWVGVLVWLWRRNLTETILASAILAMSWEVGYHARWIAPDGILMQFGAAWAIAAWMAYRGGPRRRFWLCVASVLGGLACGTKYTGGVTLIPLILIARGLDGVDRNRRGDLVTVVSCFAAAAVVSTPGALLEPLRFVHDVVAEVRHYAHGHGPNTVGPVFEHGYLMLRYLATSAFSPYWPIALLFFFLATVGVVDAVRTEPRSALVLLLVPAVYALYLATQKVMIVRNLLFVLPFLAVVAARGFTWCRERLSGFVPRGVLVGAVCLCLAANAVWLVRAGEDIRHRAGLHPAEAAAAYLTNHADERFVVSRGVRRSLDAAGESPPNVVTDPEKADRLLVLSSDLGNWVANRRGFYRVVSGTREVNIDYYPNWAGDAKLLEIDAKDYDEIWFETE